jgi:hypothetical protein
MFLFQFLAAGVCAYAIYEAITAKDNYERDMAAIVAVGFGIVTVFAF